MSFSLNRATLIGNLGRDAEVRVTASSVEVTSFSVATTHSRKNQDGNFTEETTWHNIVAFSLSDYTKNQLKKGAKIYVEGRITTREYVPRDAAPETGKRYITEIIAERIIPLSTGRGGEYSGYSSAPATSSPTGIDEPVINSSGKDDDLPF